MSASAAAAVHGHDEHGHDHGPVVWPQDPQFGLATPGKIAMWIFLLSDAFSFSGLLLGYGLLRGGSVQWHHPGEPELGINFTAILTFLLICSSVSMVMALAAAQEHDRKKTAFWLFLTILGGVGFLCGQMHEYFGFLPFLGGGEHGLIGEGLVFGHSDYANTFFVTTTFHGCHVTAGVIYLSVILINTLRGKYGDNPAGPVELVGLFWHFVDLVWILVFTLIYLIP